MATGSITVTETGTVYLRAWGLRARLAFARDQQESTSDIDAALEVLARTVVGEDGEQIWDADGWDIYSGLHPEASIDLITAARQVAGMDAEESKKK